MFYDCSIPVKEIEGKEMGLRKQRWVFLFLELHDSYDTLLSKFVANGSDKDKQGFLKKFTLSKMYNGVYSFLVPLSLNDVFQSATLQILSKTSFVKFLLTTRS